MTSKTEYFTVNRIALLAVLTAFITVGRMVFALPILPNIQPMTAMLLLITLNIGVIDGVVVSVLSVVLTNLFLGSGPWTIMQILSFTVVILLTTIIKALYTYGTIFNRIIFSIWAGLAGLIFGLTISYMSYHLYGMNNFWIYYINGLPFDVLHAGGNIVFFFILEPVIVPVIQKKFKQQTI